MVSPVLLSRTLPHASAPYTLATLLLVIGALLTIVVASAAGKLTLILQVPLKTLGILLGDGAVMMVGHVLIVKAIVLDDVSRVFPTTTEFYILSSVVISVLLAHERVSWQSALGGFAVSR